MIPPLPVNRPLATAEHLPTIDFETYSEAGYLWLPEDQKWGRLPGLPATKKGLKAVGVRAYAEHPSADIVTLSYDLLDGLGVRRWNPAMPPPLDLWRHVQNGGILEAHNSGFEQTIWECICVAKYGWPPMHIRQWRCSAAKARAYGLPPGLEKLGEALRLDTRKDPEGKRLMRVFSMPRNPTKTNPATRVLPSDKPDEGEAYARYCDRDVQTEMAASAKMPALIPEEQEFWFCDQAVNRRGVGVDSASVDACCELVTHTLAELDAECVRLTGSTTSQGSQLIGWLAAHGVHTSSLDEENLDALLARSDLPEIARKVLELRQAGASASVKKVFSMRAHTSSGNRVRDLFVYHGASTGRDTHQDVQPGNLPKAGPKLRWCESDGCGKPYGRHLDACPWCGTSAAFSRETGWTWQAAEDVLWLIRTTRSPDAVRMFFGDPLLSVSGCVRSLFCAAPGHDLISSDYSSIEAVVAACLSGEQWRIDAFHRKECIYLHGAAGITGKTYQWYLENGGKKHPDRQNIGKPGELGLGFGGWVSAWRAFGGEGSDDEIKAKIVAWREASPAIVEMWGGQVRGKPWAPDYPELYGLEGMAIAATLEPGRTFAYRQISYQVLDDCLLCTLPSGRRIAYQEPRLAPGKWEGQLSLSYMTWNTNPKMGPIGWIRKDTYGGRLFENCLAEGTLVLTDRGWVEIENVLPNDLVHDGVEFVSHRGSLFKSVEPCVMVDGVLMTPDHEVLTDDGWKAASQVDRPYRPAIRELDRLQARTRQKRWETLGILLRGLWNRGNSGSKRCEEGGKGGEGSMLRLHAALPTGSKPDHSWDEQTPGVRSVEINARPLPTPESSILGKLRRAGNNGLRKVAAWVPGVLGRHGAYVPKRARTRPKGQQCGVLPGKLPMDSEIRAGEQPSRKRENPYSPGGNVGCSGIKALRNTKGNPALESAERVGRGEVTRRVFDIFNCGPRHRFVVLGDSGPFIVHNCVQATARDVMRDAVVRLEAAGYPVVLRVHDELASEVPEGFGSVEEYERLMEPTADWCKGWPIRADGGWRGKRYRKAD